MIWVFCGKSRVKSQRGKVTDLVFTSISWHEELICHNLSRKFTHEGIFTCCNVCVFTFDMFERERFIVKLRGYLSLSFKCMIHVSSQEQFCLGLRRVYLETQSSPVNQIYYQNWNHCILVQAFGRSFNPKWLAVQGLSNHLENFFKLKQFGKNLF